MIFVTAVMKFAAYVTILDPCVKKLLLFNDFNERMIHVNLYFSWPLDLQKIRQESVQDFIFLVEQN